MHNLLEPTPATRSILQHRETLNLHALYVCRHTGRLFLRCIQYLQGVGNYGRKGLDLFVLDSLELPEFRLSEDKVVLLYKISVTYI
jgi:hypothetical protein